jgi:hypothetical protein
VYGCVCFIQGLLLDRFLEFQIHIYFIFKISFYVSAILFILILKYILLWCLVKNVAFFRLEIERKDGFDVKKKKSFDKKDSIEYHNPFENKSTVLKIIIYNYKMIIYLQIFLDCPLLSLPNNVWRLIVFAPFLIIIIIIILSFYHFVIINNKL